VLRYATRMPQRIDWIDRARGIGIVLVVVGHALLSTSTGAFAAKVIYAFHMPLFFFLSGLLAGRKHRDDLGHRAAHLARALLVPFAFFGAVTLAFHLAYDSVTKRHAASLHHVAEVTARMGYALVESIPDNNVLWFFPCLFLAAVWSLALTRAVGQRAAFALTLAAAAAAMIFETRQDRPPWSADSALIAALFFQAAMALGASPARGTSRTLSRPSALALATAAFVVTGLVTAANGRVDLAEFVFGNPALYLLGAASGTAGVVLLATALPSVGALRRLSADSRVIFPLHILVFRSLQGVPQVLFGWQEGWLSESGLTGALIFAAAGILVPIPAAWVLRRLAPWTIGENAAPPRALDHR
jgi:acyltransferase